MTNSHRRAEWFCIVSPQYGLLPFTSHTTRLGCVRRFELWGVDRFNDTPKNVKEMWQQSKKEGFRCKKIKVRVV